MQQRHPRTHAQRLADVVGHEERGLAHPRTQVQKQALQFHAGDRVERGEGFVQQQYRRIRRQRARDPYPLPLSS